MAETATRAAVLVACCQWSNPDAGTPLADFLGARLYGEQLGLRLDGTALAALSPETLDHILANRNPADVYGRPGGLVFAFVELNLPSLLCVAGVPPGEVWLYTVARPAGLACIPVSEWRSPDFLMRV